MLVHCISESRPFRFATATYRGAWEIQHCHEPDGPLMWFRARQPLILEWDLGDRWDRNPIRLGDFVHVPGRAAVSPDVCDELQAKFSGWTPSYVDLLPGPRELNIEAAGLREIWVTRWMNADMERSTYVEHERCRQCGRQTFWLRDIEAAPLDILIAEPGQPIMTERRPRVPGHGLYIREADLAGASVFRVHEFGGLMVTEDFVEFVKARGYTNIDFREVGETF